MKTLISSNNYNPLNFFTNHSFLKNNKQIICRTFKSPYRYYIYSFNLLFCGFLFNEIFFHGILMRIEIKNCVTFLLMYLILIYKGLIFHLIKLFLLTLIGCDSFYIFYLKPIHYVIFILLSDFKMLVLKINNSSPNN